MQGGAAISKDLPPYTIARGYNGICGLNMIGLRRAGASAADRLELKQVYHTLFRNGLNLRSALEHAQKSFSGERSKMLLEFVAGGATGVALTPESATSRMESRTIKPREGRSRMTGSRWCGSVEV